MTCPRCKNSLKTEKYEDVEVDNCKSCGGTWLDDGEIKTIIDTREQSFSPKIIHDTLVSAFSGVPKDEQEASLKCPKCESSMPALNYDYKSGIIINSCPQGHGIWLDKDELKKVQIYREHCEKEAAKNRKEWMSLAKKVANDQNKIIDENLKRDKKPSQYIISSILNKIIGD